MATIDCTLDSFKIPGLPLYEAEFGTKKADNKGLTTEECVIDTAMPFSRQRPFSVTEDSETGTVEAHSAFEFASGGLTLSLGAGAFTGCECLVRNAGDAACKVTGLADGDILVGAGATARLTWAGGWRAEGDYCQNGTWHARTARGLLAWAAYMDETGKCDASCAMDASIDMAGVEWTPVGTEENPYAGFFSGGGHSLHNLKVAIESGEDADVAAGFFGYLGAGAVAQDLSLVDVDISASYTGSGSYYTYTGGLVGYANADEGTQPLIKNISASGSVQASNTTASNTRVGGILGTGTCLISHCLNKAAVSGGARVGGIAGYSGGAISSCQNSGTVTASGERVGGIAGRSGGAISSCQNSGTVTGGGNCAGGIAGYNYGGSSSNIAICVSCTNLGTVSGTTYVGGVVGYNSSYASTNVVSCCANKGTVTGSSYVGGVVGCNNGSMTYCVSAGSPTSSTGSA